MPLAAQGSTYPWPAFVRDETETLVDASALTLDVRNGAGVSQAGFPLTLAGGGIVRDSLGTYHADWAIPVDQTIGTYYGYWSGVFAGGLLIDESAEQLDVVAPGSIVPGVTPTYTYDLTTEVGLLRFYIQDHDMSAVSTSLPLERRSAVFSDEELTILLANEGSLMKAAAQALRIWATNKNLLVIARRIGKTDVDFGSIRADLMRLAEVYDEQGSGGGDPADATVEQNWGHFSEREILVNTLLREQP